MGGDSNLQTTVYHSCLFQDASSLPLEVATSLQKGDLPMSNLRGKMLNQDFLFSLGQRQDPTLPCTSSVYPVPEKVEGTGMK